MKIKKNYFFAFTVFLATSLSWITTVRFWFDNYDLPYFNQYLAVTNFPKGLNFLDVVRGHVLLQLFIYPFSGLNPEGYYLLTCLLHGLVAALFFYLLLKLTKSKLLSLILALFFGVNIVYSDVLYEGAFNGYYTVILLICLASFYIFLFSKFRIRLKIFLIILLTAIGLLFRETAIIIPSLIFLAILVFSKNVKDIFHKLPTIVTPVVFVIGYLVFRAKVLGTLASDLSDDAVQARTAYLASGRIIPLMLSVLANVLRMLSEQIVPYTILYSVRKNISVWVLGQGFDRNFATNYVVFVGFIAVVAIVILSYLIIRKADTLVKRMWFLGLGWFLTFAFFTSIVLPFPDHVLSLDYGFATVLSRYNYYSFIGIVLMIGSLVLFYPKLRKILLSILVLIIVANFFEIQKGANYLYSTFHAQAKDFHNKISTTYGYKFPQNSLIYYNFFQVNNLRDRIWELVYIYAKKDSPTSTFTFESTLADVEKNFLNKSVTLDKVFAFDLDTDGFLVDKTKELRDSLNGLTALNLSFDKTNSSFAFQSPQNANFRYNLEFDAQMINSQQYETCDSLFKEYLEQRYKFLSSATINVSTEKGIHSLFPYSLGKNLIDNQFVWDSSWEPDSYSSGQWVMIDLGSAKTINGFSWMSDGGYGTPNSYDIYASDDKVVWNKIVSINNSDESSRIDYFSPVKKRYVKMVIQSTKFGQPVLIREVEALNYPDEIKKYSEWNKLLTDAYTYACTINASNISLGNINWTSNRNTEVTRNEFFYTDGKWNHYVLPVINWEPYSKSLNILDEKFSSINIHLNSDNVQYNIKNAKLIPAKL